MRVGLAVLLVLLCQFVSNNSTALKVVLQRANTVASISNNKGLSAFNWVPQLINLSGPGK